MPTLELTPIHKVFSAYYDNPNISIEAVEEMIIQQIFTVTDFISRNVIAQENENTISARRMGVKRESKLFVQRSPDVYANA